MILQLIIITGIVLQAVAASSIATFFEFEGLECTRPEFVETHADVASKTECASRCAVTSNCQALSVTTGHCQLFVFNRCSRYVRDSNCTRRAQVAMKQQPGLPPRALCPPGFKDDFYGTKYKMILNVTDWEIAKNLTDSEPGFTIMADVADLAEMAHLDAIFSRDGLAKVMLGGTQPPDSEEPDGGWVWASCNINISSSLWIDGQPNNSGNKENTVLTGAEVMGITDGRPVKPPVNAYDGALTECLSPFT